MVLEPLPPELLGLPICGNRGVVRVDLRGSLRIIVCGVVFRDVFTRHFAAQCARSSREGGRAASGTPPGRSPCGRGATVVAERQFERSENLGHALLGAGDRAPKLSEPVHCISG
eukprot:scaffold35454_cov202-Isochrysis_galbana.AAC.1